MIDERLGVRLSTMRQTIDLLEERGGTQIVETGTTRSQNEWGGDGMSSLVFGSWASEHGGHLWTVDADPGNLENCRTLTREWAESITYVHDDSVNFLAGFSDRIDLLYLDSFDYPLIDLVRLYGDDFDETCAILRNLGDEYLVEHHNDILADSQRHAEREMKAALPLLHPRSLVLIDDANLPGGGKARLARKVLRIAGYECLADEYQTLWSKP